MEKYFVIFSAPDEDIEFLIDFPDTEEEYCEGGLRSVLTSTNNFTDGCRSIFQMWLTDTHSEFGLDPESFAFSNDELPKLLTAVKAITVEFVERKLAQWYEGQSKEGIATIEESQQLVDDFADFALKLEEVIQEGRGVMWISLEKKSRKFPPIAFYLILLIVLILLLVKYVFAGVIAVILIFSIPLIITAIIHYIVESDFDPNFWGNKERSGDGTGGGDGDGGGG